MFTRALRTPVIIIVGILSAFIIWQIGFPHVAMVMLSGIIILCVYYASIYLYLKNDSMMGGLPNANFGYTLGFVIILSGNLIIPMSFILDIPGMISIGSVLLLIGTGFMVGSCTLLFRHIIRRGF